MKIGLPGKSILRDYFQENQKAVPKTNIFGEEVHFFEKGVYITFFFLEQPPGRRSLLCGKVYFFQEDLFEFWFLEQPSDFLKTFSLSKNLFFREAMA